MGTMIDATYSPEDDKLRLYAATRLDQETYERVKAAGFRWAPKQELFFAVWSPGRERLAEELAGEIGDEGTSLADRAAERAERFATYSEKRERDAERQAENVRRIADNIPLGQPILVGHHSEKRARKDAERIENGMRKAVQLWKTSEHWQQKAADVKRHADYKAQPRVRARRIKALEADLRRWEATYTTPKKYEGQVTMQRPIVGCWEQHGHNAECEKCTLQPHVVTGQGRAAHWTPVRCIEPAKRRAAPWIEHLKHRIAYERALLDEQGASSLLEKKKRPAAPPLLNYPAEVIETRSPWRETNDRFPQKRMTKAEYAKAWKDNKGTRVVADGSHRVRILIESRTWYTVFLTDSKEHECPSSGGAVLFG